MSFTPMAFLRPDHVKVKSFSATSRGSATVVKIELEVVEGAELGHLLADLQAMRAWKPAPAPKQLALPAPKGDAS
jgi:hypothetical protein